MSGGRLTEHPFGWVIGVTMQKLMIDLETKSDVDITKAGVYRYADSPYFDILLFAYSVDDAPVQVVDLACGEHLPEEILKALTDDRIQKHAFNASFERVCLSVWLHRNYPERFVSYGSPEDACGNYLSPKAWRCTMVAAAYLGLPLSLASVGAVLQLQQQKMSEGKALIRYFCVPYDHVNGISVFHSPTDAPKKWNVFRAYNKRDVETEQAIEQKIARFPVPEFVWQEYALDQSINDRGIQLDLQLVQQAIRMDTLTKDKPLRRTCKPCCYCDNKYQNPRSKSIKPCRTPSARMVVQEACFSSMVQIEQVERLVVSFSCKTCRRITFPIWKMHGSL